jgi:hypothetical protein
VSVARRAGTTGALRRATLTEVIGTGPGSALLTNFAAVGVMSMMRPPGFSNVRAVLPGSVPGVSKTMSNRPASAVASKSDPTIGAMPRSRASCAAVPRQLPPTEAPRARAICAADRPTPPRQPWMKTARPACTWPVVTMAWKAVSPTVGSAAASSQERFAGFFTTAFSSATTRTSPGPGRLGSKSSSRSTSGPPYRWYWMRLAVVTVDLPALMSADDISLAQ